ncbi:MAG: hypothetical protein WCI61_11230, partial [Chloroflexota bacterium]
MPNYAVVMGLSLVGTVLALGCTPGNGSSVVAKVTAVATAIRSETTGPVPAAGTAQPTATGSPPPIPTPQPCIPGPSALTDGIPSIESEPLGLAVTSRNGDLWLLPLDNPTAGVRLTSCRLAHYAGAVRRPGALAIYYLIRSSDTETSGRESVVYRSTIGARRTETIFRQACPGACPSDAAIAQDGKRLAIAGNSGLSIHDLSAGTIIEVAKRPPGRYPDGLSWGDPQWSADGRYLAFDVETTVGTQYVFDTQRGTTQQVSSQSYRPRWSTTGSAICMGLGQRNRDGDFLDME